MWVTVAPRSDGVRQGATTPQTPYPSLHRCLGGRPVGEGDDAGGEGFGLDQLQGGGDTGGEELLAGLTKRLNSKVGGTTADGNVTLEFAECLGACEQAPCILVNDECHGNQSEESVLKLIENK